MKRAFHIAWLAGFPVLGLAVSPASGALTAYYTLDNLSSGVANQGTTGSASDLSPADAAATPTPVSGGIRGGALSFDGGDLLRNIDAGNAGDLLTGYPFTMSVWMRNVTVDSSRDAVFGVSDRAQAGRYYVTGTQGVSGRQEPELIRRNPDFTELNATGANVSGTAWTHVLSIFGTGGAQIFVNGQSVNSVTGGQTFDASVNTISIGGFLRNNSTTTPTDAFAGQADEIGLFDNALTAVDAALINGLGHLGGVGLDQLDEAQALNGSAFGSTAFIDGVQWRRAAGLTGAQGAYGGTLAGGDAFIVTDGAGNGIRVVPEPGAVAVLGAGLVGLLLRRRARA